jgi:hypothetical protein
LPPFVTIDTLELTRKYWRIISTNWGIIAEESVSFRRCSAGILLSGDVQQLLSCCVQQTFSYRKCLALPSVQEMFSRPVSFRKCSGASFQVVFSRTIFFEGSVFFN